MSQFLKAPDVMEQLYHETTIRQLDLSPNTTRQIHNTMDFYLTSLHVMIFGKVYIQLPPFDFIWILHVWHYVTKNLRSQSRMHFLTILHGKLVRKSMDVEQ